MTKKVIMVGVVISLFLSIHAYVFAATDNHPAIELDGTEMDAVAYIDGGNVYLPLRAVGEALGYKIQWSGEENPISVSKPGENIMIDLNNHKITANNHTYYTSGDYPGKAVNGGTTVGNSTYMGADFFSDNFGLKVRWDRQNGIIQLESVKENAISVKTVKEVSETDTIKITLQFPQIEGWLKKTCRTV